MKSESDTILEEPKEKRAIAFFDGQNLYRRSKTLFGYHHPNYDPHKLFQKICDENSWTNKAIRFYTGVPSAEKSLMWQKYWSNRLLAMRRSGILVESRPIKYRTKEIKLPDGTMHNVDTPQEKGIDVKIALDVLRLAFKNRYDVAVIFSEDQDLSEVASEVVDIAKSQHRWIKVCSAFPVSSQDHSRGINKTDWIEIDKDMYDQCIDHRDYR